MKRLPCPLESQEAETLVAWLRVKGITFMHIPSETGSSPEARRRAIRMKRQGVVRGFPDYVIALPSVGVLYVELKRVHGSVVSQEQKDWLYLLNKCPGTQAVVAKGAKEAIKFIESFIVIRPTTTSTF